MKHLSHDFLILICTMITEGTFLIYYIKQRPLPIAINKILFKTIKCSMFLTVVDLVATFAISNSILKQQGILLYILIANYYLVYQLVYLYLAEYIMLKCDKNKQLAWIQNKEMFILGIVGVILVINYFSHHIFYLTRINEFRMGNHHVLIHIIPIFVLVYSLFSVVKKYYQDAYKGIFYSLIIVLLGIVMQFFINTVALEVCLAMGVGMLYITIDSPVFFESEAIKSIYNTKAFIALTNEYILTGKEFYVYGVNIYNFTSLKARYGINDFYIGLENFCNWLKQESYNGYVFYTNNECFNIVTTTPINGDSFSEKLIQRTKKSFKTSNNEMYIWSKLLVVDTMHDFCNSGSDIINVEKAALEVYAEKDSKIDVGEDNFKQLKYNNKIESIIQDCVDNKEIEIYIQPIYNSKTRKIEGGEILTRIKHDELGLIMPDKFIPLSEKNGSIFELSLLIFEKTCLYASTHDLDNAGIEFINVNCSPVQFQNINLANELKDISDKYGVLFSLFDFEVTESNMNAENLLGKHIAKLKEYQATVSLDDFGVGGSDIFRLLNYDFSLAKLDKSLVWNYFDDKSSVVVDIINMFKHEDLKIVAEGVETKEMVDKLTELGCDYLQGYYFSKPLPAEEFLDFVSDFNGHK